MGIYLGSFESDGFGLCPSHSHYDDCGWLEPNEATTRSTGHASLQAGADLQIRKVLLIILQTHSVALRPPLASILLYSIVSIYIL